MERDLISLVPVWYTTLKVNDETIDRAFQECINLYNSGMPSEKKSNRGGWQSQNLVFENLSDPNLQAIASIFKIIFEVHIPYVQQDLLIEHNFKLSNFWININRKNCYNAVHVHPLSHISGVFYLTEKNSALHINHYDVMTNWLDSINSKRRKEPKIVPEKKQLLLFPSWLPHNVEPSVEETARVSIAFNARINDYF